LNYAQAGANTNGMTEIEAVIMMTNQPASVDENTNEQQSGDGVNDGASYQRIEQVAARTGLTKRTLRYYEEIGLLPPPTRTEGGYRLYSEADVQQLERIKRLKDLLGFSLAEIRELADAEVQREHVRVAWRQEKDPRARLAWLDRSEELTRRQLRLVEEKLAGLREMQTNLNARLTRIENLRAETREQLEEY
jgi:DNA-binding transcriptional MerR regulator